jgi:integrase
MARPRKRPKNVRRLESGQYRAVVAYDGKRRYGPRRDTAEEAARDAAALGSAKGSVPSDLWTMQQGLDQVMADLMAEGKRPATLAYYRNHARILLRAWDGDTPLHAITPNDVRIYVQVRLQAGVRLETIWGKELQVLARVCNLAVRRGALPESPLAQIKKPQLRPRQFTWLPIDQAARLLEQIRAWPGPVRNQERDADIITMALLTGCRRAELARLRVGDVDLAARRIHVEGKNRNRYAPIADELMPVVSRLLLRAGDGPLVGSERLIEKVFAVWQRRLGEPRLAPRALRHSYATELATDGGTNPFELRELMGHSNLRQTQRYFHARGSRTQAAVNQLGARLGAGNRRAETSGEDPAVETRATP